MDKLGAAHLKQQTRELGFDLCGVAAAGPARTHDRYIEWLAHGYHAGMSYMARPDAVARRADPRELLAGAKSVVVVALNYYAHPYPSPPPTRGRGQGKVARYAWGPDYHRVMTRKLKQLAAWIEAEAGQQVAHKICVDTSAILEREWAVRAGLGWIGKNTMLINPRLGSWSLLGELLLDLALEPDSPFTIDRCGTCTRCLEACPTACLSSERVLDARRCISYLTIESRDDIPAELRASVGQWLFGCDVCQEVCPWNRKTPPSTTVEVNPAWTSLDPTEILAMDETTFRARFAGSAIKRAKRSGLARNAAVVMENAN